MKLETIDDVLRLNTLCGIQDKAQADPQGKTMGLLVNRLTQCGIRDKVEQIINGGGGDGPKSTEIWYWGEYYDMQAAIDMMSAMVPYKGPTIKSNEEDPNEPGKYVIKFNDNVIKTGIEGGEQPTGMYPFFVNRPGMFSCNITQFKLPSTVKELIQYSFMGCTSLTAVDIPSNAVNISGAFAGCSGLKNVVIPDKVTAIESSFSACSGLESAVLGKNIKISVSAFVNCSSLSSVIIPEGVDNIGKEAFRNCSSLTVVTIPNSVTSIGEGAFEDCTGLPVFDNVRYADICLVNAVDKTLSSYIIKEGTKFIAENAFFECTDLTSITIPNSVISIGDDAFSGCSSLSSVTIPNSVTNIGEWTFYNCSSLTFINIPNGITNIKDATFMGCISLTSIEIPSNVTIIEERVFNLCAGLTSITIPSSVTSIGYQAFYGCSGLTYITCEATNPPTLGDNTFDGTNDCTIYVPTDSVEAYKSSWSNYADRIQAIQ